MSGTAPDEAQVPACYRHPDRPALTKCSRCDRPICGDDLIEAPVGYQCPECAKGGQPVRRLRDLRPDPQLTKVLVGAIVVGFVVTRGTALSELGTQGALVPVMVGAGEWWRIVTSGFVHAGFIHIAFNGYLLWLLGGMLEPTVGRERFGLLYLGGLVGGSLGVVFLTWLTVRTPLLDLPLLGTVFAVNPFGRTVGASGAVFALMGVAMVGLHQRGVNPWRTDIGTLVILNLALTFFIPQISVGGHLGGLLTGAGLATILVRDRQRPSSLLGAAIVAAMFVATVVLARAVVG